MNNLNSLILEGNVSTKVELKEPTPNFKVATFSIAVNRYYKNSDGENVEEVSYFDIECYGALAQIAENKAELGRGVRIVGRLKQNRWTDDDGKKHSKVFIVAEHIELRPIYHKKENANEDSKIF